MLSKNNESNNYFCSKPWTSFGIQDHKGNVAPCCWSKINCGNINQETIEEIWNGEAYIHMRRLMADGDLDSICSSSCPYRLGEFRDPLIEPQSEAFRKNLLLQKSEIEDRKLILESKPIEMRIVPTVACNLKCVMCYQERSDTVVLPPNIDKVLSSYYPTLYELLVLGGEALLDKKALGIIGSLNSEEYPDLHLSLITNGSVISHDVESLLLKKNISWIFVSIDAATPQTYRKIRGGNLENVIDGINTLKKIRNAQNANWSLVIGFTLMPSNFEELVDFAKLSRELETDFAFTPVFVESSHRESFSNKPMIVHQAKKFLENLEEYLTLSYGSKLKAQRLRMYLEDLEKNLTIESINDM